MHSRKGLLPMPRRLLSVAATGVLLLGLAGCGNGGSETVSTPPPDLGIDAPSDGGGDSPEPSDGGSESSSAESTAEAPNIPPPDPAEYAGMDERTEEGAIQAFRYYIAVSMWSHQVGDDELLDSLQTDSCYGCAYLNSELPQLQESGTHWSQFEVNDVQITPHDSKNFDYEIGYSFTIPEHTRPDSETGDPIAYAAVEHIAVGGLTWEDGSWIVGGLTSEWGPDAHG